MIVDTQYSPQLRAERVIASGRLVLAVFSLLAIWLDPTDPTRYARLAHVLVIGYAAYALVVALLVWHADLPLMVLQFVTHILDLAVLALFMLYTEGSSSPFFVYFLFFLVCATLRWQWRGTLWTAVGVLTVFIGMGLYMAQVVRDPVFELNRFIIRSVNLAVVAVLLGYLGAYEQQLRSELSRLAAWPRTVPKDARDLVGKVLEHAASVLRAPRVLMVWDEPEEPWLNLALWSRGELQWSREPPGTFETPVAESLEGKDFLCHDVCGRAPTPVVHATPDGLQRWHGRPLHPELQRRFGMGGVLSLRLEGEGVRGRLFVLDIPGINSDDLVLGEIVAGRVVALMDQFHLMQRLRVTAATEERIRLARDLHDGLLQSMAGIALHLEAVSRLIESDPQAARESLAEVQRLLVDEQRDLRFLVRQLKPVPAAASGTDVRLGARLHQLRDRIECHWGLQVNMKIKRIDPRISNTLAQGIYFIVHEAIINAARHAAASIVRVELEIEDNYAHIVVADDGRGFPFRGRYLHAALTAMNLGPVTIMERVEALGGALAVESTETGANLEILLPLERRGAQNASSPGAC